jgi:hypothetical protein
MPYSFGTDFWSVLDTFGVYVSSTADLFFGVDVWSRYDSFGADVWPMSDRLKDAL